MPIITVPKADVLTFVEEKFERRLSEEIGKVNERLTTDLAKVNERLTTELAKVNERLTTELGKITLEFARVRQEMAEMKADLIRWMFLFWVGQVAVVFGILFAFFRK